MTIDNQKIIPAISTYKEVKLFKDSSLLVCILVDFQLAELESVVSELKSSNKKVLIHLDMIKGLASNEFGAIHLIQNLKVDGIISTKPQPLILAKKRGVIAIQRIFLKDSFSLERSLVIVDRIQPDYLELLPAISTSILSKIITKTKLKVICGGLIQSFDEIDVCFKYGAVGVSTSNTEFWNV